MSEKKKQLASELLICQDDRHFSCCAPALFRAGWTSFPVRRPHLSTNGHPSVLQSFTSQLLAAVKCPESPSRTRTFSTGPFAQSRCTQSTHWPQTPPSWLSYLLECHKRRNSNLIGISSPSLPSGHCWARAALPPWPAGFSWTPPSSPRLWNYNWNVPQTRSCPKARELKATLQPLLWYPTLN